MISARLSVPDGQGALEKVFAAEEQGLLNDRASYKVSRHDGSCVIEVSARDATALRAVLNSVCKTLIVFEKARQVIDDE